MEPLSVTASVVAVLGAARRLSKGIGLLKAARGAPESLDDLLLHLTGIEEVLHAIQDVPTEPSTISRVLPESSVGQKQSSSRWMP